MTPANKDRNTGPAGKGKKPQQGGNATHGSGSGNKPAGKGQGTGGTSRTPAPPSAPRSGSDDDEDANEQTAPGKPKEFDETVRRKRGEERVEDEAAEE